MNRSLYSRLEKLEAAGNPSRRERVLTMFARGESRAEIDAQIAAFKQAEGVTDRDTLVVFRTFYEPKPEGVG